jgi:tripartite-type tricarboxylate transporter receptor subunit TctC
MVAHFPPGGPTDLVARMVGQKGVEMMKHMTGIDMAHIPYKGTTPAMTDVTAGHVSLMFNSMPTVLPLTAAKKLKGLAVSSRSNASCRRVATTKAAR